MSGCLKRLELGMRENAEPGMTPAHLSEASISRSFLEALFGFASLASRSERGPSLAHCWLLGAVLDGMYREDIVIFTDMDVST